MPAIRNVIVGNEPNLNRFWLPQFNPDGTDAAAPAYEALLAQAYDAIKAVDPTVTVFGGALAPRGVDKPNTGRDTHSPTAFIADMGAAYRASGRTAPIMDGVRLPSVRRGVEREARPRASELDVDRPRRLLEARRAARPGVRRNRAGRDRRSRSSTTSTASSRRSPRRSSPRTRGNEPATTHPVDETTQAVVLHAGAEHGVLPAERRRHPPLPLTGRERARELAVGRLLRRRLDRRRASGPCARPSTGRAAGRSPTATICRSTSSRRSCASRRRRRSPVEGRDPAHVPARLRRDARADARRREDRVEPQGVRARRVRRIASRSGSCASRPGGTRSPDRSCTR